jgi:hypothetical protein
MFRRELAAKATGVQLFSMDFFATDERSIPNRPLSLLCYLMKLVLAMLFGAGKIAAMNLSAAS